MYFRYLTVMYSRYIITPPPPTTDQPMERWMRAWRARQLRMNARAALTGLLAGGAKDEPEQLAQKAVMYARALLAATSAKNTKH